MGGSNTTSTQSTASSDPQVQKTLDPLLKGLSTAYAAGPHVFNQSLYQPAGATTQGAWGSALTAANNPQYAAGVNGAIGNQANIAAGNAYGTNDPGYAALRAKVANDTLTGVNSSYNNSGLFGSDNNRTSAALGLGQALGGLDYQNFQNDQQRQQQAISNLPGLYQAAQAPGATMGAIGSAQDTNQQGILTGANDLYRRQSDAGLDLTAKAAGVLSGASPSAGQTTTSTSPSQPWWMSAAGLGLSLL